MKYKKKFPICPFRSGTGKCSHKGSSICTYPNQPFKCELYNKWLDKLKDDFYCVETPIRTNYKESDNE